MRHDPGGAFELLGRYVWGLQFQIWPIQRSVPVLWAPDSQVFAPDRQPLRQLSYVLSCGTNFRLG